MPLKKSMKSLSDMWAGEGWQMPLTANARNEQRIFLNPPHTEKSLEKPKLEAYQKYYENGEYLQSAELTEEQNYNMIDGRIDNIPEKKKTGTGICIKKAASKTRRI